MIKAIRDKYLAKKIVFIDGQPGCGKTMLSPIISALDRVELLTYTYETEQALQLYYLNRMEEDAVIALVRLHTDLRLYNSLMSREVNFRYKDLSSIFRDQPIKYLKRIFEKGDDAVFDKIDAENPILNLTTHNLLGIAEPLFKAFNDRLVFIEVVRHPLYSIKQQVLNMERLLYSPKHFTTYFEHQEKQYPFWAFEMKDYFHKLNAVEKTIYSIDVWNKVTEQSKNKILKLNMGKLITIPFEKFVLDPWPYMNDIVRSLESKITKRTLRVMKTQKVPRKMIADGLPLEIYKHCGWEPPVSKSEKTEYEVRRDWVEKQISSEAKKVLDKICENYENTYLEGPK